MENALMVVASVLAAGLIGAGAALGAALGNSRVTSTTIECMARQPEVQARLFTVFLLGSAFVEALALIGFVVALIVK